MRKRTQPRRFCAGFGFDVLTSAEALDLLGPVVYATRSGDRIKIGYSANLKSRLSDLGGRDGLLAFLPAADMEAEAAIHRQLRGHAVERREWYAADDPAVLEVVNQMRDFLGLPTIAA